jgi:CHAD domain-containing protein
MSGTEPAGRFTQPPGARLRAVAATELLRAIDHLGWRGPRLHTGVHQARKSMRRTRAVLALGMPALGPGAKLVDRELRRVIRSLSRLRDAHALIGTFDHLLEKESAHGDVVALLRRARRGAARARAATARAVLADDPQLQERLALLLTLHAAMGGLDWAAVDAACIATALQHGTQQIEAASVRARESGHDEDWHRWRRRARRLSQQHTALGEAAPSTEADAEGKRLAVLLGQAQDYAMLIAGCGRKSGIAKADRERLRELADARLTRIRGRIARRQRAP